VQAGSLHPVSAQVGIVAFKPLAAAFRTITGQQGISKRYNFTLLRS
jgi:hypothetical protein